jgi:hypothetical protein
LEKEKPTNWNIYVWNGNKSSSKIQNYNVCFALNLEKTLESLSNLSVVFGVGKPVSFGSIFKDGNQIF